MYKLQNDLAQSYIINICPGKVGLNNEYNLRNANDLRHLIHHTEYLKKLYIPSTIKLWNSLKPEIRNSPSVNSFKSNLKKIYDQCQLYKPYLKGKGSGHIHLSRTRMGLSALNFQRYHKNLIDDPTCPSCNLRSEKICHFLLECPSYTAHREILYEALRLILPQNQLSHLTTTTKKMRNNLAKHLIL